MTTQPVVNIKSSKALFYMRLGTTVSRWIFGSYEKAYVWAVSEEANQSCISKVNPLPEIAAVYLLAQAALRHQITIKGRRVNLKMDSVIDYQGGTANACIETLQCMLFDSRNKAEQSTFNLDQLRVYPVLVNNLPMQGLQNCYFEHSGKIIQRVQKLCVQHRIELPDPCMDYDPMNPKHVVRWLEEILLKNRISPQYIEASVRAISAIGDLKTLMAKHWISDCLSDYLYCFEKQTANVTTQSLSVMASEQTLQRQSEKIVRKQLDGLLQQFASEEMLQRQAEEAVRKQLDELLQQFAQRKQNQSVTLEVRQRVS
jgi:hypothetical protein